LASLDTWAHQAKRIGIFSLAKPASYCPDIVSGVANFCFRNRRQVDGIIITGDLATTGMHADLNVARSFLSDPAIVAYSAQSRSPTLNSSELPIYLVAGNHDRYANNGATPNSRNFDLLFDEYLRNFDGFVGHWVVKKDSQSIAFISADFSLRTRGDATAHINAYGQGRVYSDTLKNLTDRSFALKAKFPGVAIFWLIHFAPFDCGPRLELIGWDQIAASASALGVTATLCGHTHKPFRVQLSDHSIFCAGSAGCADSEDNSFVHILDIQIDKTTKVVRHSYKWDFDLDEFRHDGTD
jgi:3',5'-cyclic AMP phosphodiesterase CpdA